MEHVAAPHTPVYVVRTRSTSSSPEKVWKRVFLFLKFLAYGVDVSNRYRLSIRAGSSGHRGRRGTPLRVLHRAFVEPIEFGMTAQTDSL